MFRVSRLTQQVLINQLLDLRGMAQFMFVKSLVSRFHIWLTCSYGLQNIWCEQVSWFQIVLYTHKRQTFVLKSDSCCFAQRLCFFLISHCQGKLVLMVCSAKCDNVHAVVRKRKKSTIYSRLEMEHTGKSERKPHNEKK